MAGGKKRRKAAAAAASSKAITAATAAADQSSSDAIKTAIVVLREAVKRWDKSWRSGPLREQLERSLIAVRTYLMMFGVLPAPCDDQSARPFEDTQAIPYVLVLLNLEFQLVLKWLSVPKPGTGGSMSSAQQLPMLCQWLACCSG
jgi:hypothetical protein